MEAIAVTELPEPRWAKFALFFGLFTAGIGNSFVFAILPPVGREMGMQEVQVGSIITISACVFMFCAPIWGARSEVWGRRPVLLFGFTAYCLFTVLFASVIHLRLIGALPLLAAYLLLILFRTSFSACISGVFPASQAYMADITTAEHRTSGMALLGVAIGVGMIGGPAVAALFATSGLVLPFYGVASFAVVAGLLIYFCAPELRDHAVAHYGPAEKLRKRSFLPLLLVSTGAMTNLSAVQQASGFYFQDVFELSASETAQRVGLALMASAGASVCSQLIFARRLMWPARRLMRTGVPIAFTGVALLLLSEWYPALVVAMACFGMGIGMVMPGTIATLSIKAGNRHQGSVAGMNTSAQGLGFIIGPMVGAGLYEIHPLLPYSVCLLLLGAMAADIYLFVQWPDAQMSRS